MVAPGPGSPVLDHADRDGGLIAARHGSHGHPVQRQIMHLCADPWRIFTAEPVRKQRELRMHGCTSSAATLLITTQMSEHDSGDVGIDTTPTVPWHSMQIKCK